MATIKDRDRPLVIERKNYKKIINDKELIAPRIITIKK
jgi:hypothetical protein